MQKFSPWVFWFPTALFFLFQYIMRASSATLANDMILTFGIDATEAAAIGALQYSAYSCMQIPTGMLLDRFRPKYVIMVFVSICTLGVLVFSLSEGVGQAKLGRIMIGIGSSVGWLGSLKIITTWFDSTKSAFVASFTVALGTMGAMFAGYPLAALCSSIGWGKAMMIFVLAGVGVLLAVMFLVQDKYTKRKEIGPKVGIFEGIIVMLKDRRTIPLFLLSIGIYAVLSIFADSWCVLYMKNAYNISCEEASNVVSLIYFGLMFGSPLVTFLSDKLQSRKKPLIVCFLIQLIFVPIVLYGSLPIYLVNIIFILLGVSTGAQVISFAILADYIPSKYGGSTNGMLNMGVMLTGAFMQNVTGALLRWFGGGTEIANACTVYPIDAYKKAIFILPIWIFIGLVSTFLISETYPKKKKH